MRNFVLGVLLALSVSSIAETDHADGSKTYTQHELAAMWATFQAMSGEIDRLEGEVTKANSIFIPMVNKIKELEARKCI